MNDKHAWVLFAAAKLGSMSENSADGAAKIAAKCADALLAEMKTRDLGDDARVDHRDNLTPPDGDDRMQKLTLEIMVYLKRNPGAAQGMIIQAMKGRGDREATKAALKNAEYRGQVEIRRKPGSKGELYYMTDVAPQLSVVPPLPPDFKD